MQFCRALRRSVHAVVSHKTPRGGRCGQIFQARRDCRSFATHENLESFEKIGLSPKFLKDTEHVLKDFRSGPTDVQAASIPRLLSGSNLILGSETGSGKTLAYTLPLLQMLQESDLEKGRCKPQRPRALVIMPSRELALQAFSVGKELANQLHLRTAALVGGQKMSRQRRKLAAGVEIVYANPGRLLKFLESGDIFLSQVEHVVFDEADSMFLDGFNEEMQPLLNILKKRKESPQYIFVGASMPLRLARILEMGIPGIERVTMKSLHRKPKSLAENFVDTGIHDKQDMLIQVLQAEGIAVRPEQDDAVQQAQKSKLSQWIVFCNTIQCCRSTEYFLAEHGFEVTSVHGKIPPHERRDNFSKFADGRAQILVSTDIAGRGIDIDDVSGIINFDFPRTSSDYIHRIGRTARRGRQGKAIHLVTKYDQKLAKQLKQGNFNMDDISEEVPEFAQLHRNRDAKKTMPRKLRKRIGL